MTKHMIVAQCASLPVDLHAMVFNNQKASLVRNLEVDVNPFDDPLEIHQNVLHLHYELAKNKALQMLY